MKKYLKEFVVDIDISLSPEQKQEAMRALNLHYVGDEECNKLEGDQLVGKYNDHINFKKLMDAHYAVCRSTYRRAKVGLNKNGTYEIIK